MSKWKQSYKIKSLICFLGISSMILVGGCGNREMASDQVWGRADAKEIDINTKVAGRVIQLNVKEGDHVKAGDVIAYINRRDLEAKKSQQEAVIASLTAQKAEANSLTSLESGIYAGSCTTAFCSRWNQGLRSLLWEKRRQIWRYLSGIIRDMKNFLVKGLFPGRPMICTRQNMKQHRLIMIRQDRIC